VLKTDLYDEATADGIASSLAARAESVVGVDVAPAVVAAAQRRHPWLRSVHADVRRLPFDDADFDVIVSISTLDHFPARAEMERALRELHRVLAPGGTLLITLDNLANPVVALRNALPLGPLQRLGLVPYYVGASCGPRRLRALLGSSGFEVEAITATMHCPRVACVRAAGLLHRHARTTTQRRFLRLLWAWERLGRLPTRFLTGYFVAARALKA
jgi:SAM-dependent methyltransferase